MSHISYFSWKPTKQTPLSSSCTASININASAICSNQIATWKHEQLRICLMHERQTAADMQKAIHFPALICRERGPVPLRRLLPRTACKLQRCLSRLPTDIEARRRRSETDCARIRDLAISLSRHSHVAVNPYRRVAGWSVRKFSLGQRF